MYMVLYAAVVASAWELDCGRAQPFLVYCNVCMHRVVHYCLIQFEFNCNLTRSHVVLCVCAVWKEVNGTHVKMFACACDIAGAPCRCWSFALPEIVSAFVYNYIVISGT